MTVAIGEPEVTLTLPSNAPCVVVDLKGGRLLVDDLQAGAVLAQPIDVWRRLSAIAVRVETHSGWSVGDLSATIAQPDGTVVRRHTVPLSSVRDDQFAQFRMSPPLGAGHYIVRIACKSRWFTPAAAFHLLRSGWPATTVNFKGSVMALPGGLDLVQLDDDPSDFAPGGSNLHELDEIFPAIVRFSDETEDNLPIKVQRLPRSSIVAANQASGQTFLADFAGSASLLQPLSVDEPLLAVGAVVGTYHGTARGELAARVYNMASGAVVFEGTRRVATLGDNEPVSFVIHPPAPAGRYLLEMSITVEPDARSPAIYLAPVGAGARSMRLVERERHTHLGYALANAATLRTSAGYAALRTPGTRALTAITNRRPQTDDPCALHIDRDGRMVLTDIFRDLTLIMDVPRFRGGVAAIGIEWRKPRDTGGRLWLILRDRETNAALLTNVYDLDACSHDRPLLMRAPSGRLPDRPSRLEVRCEPRGDRAFPALRCRPAGTDVRGAGMMVEGKIARVSLVLVRERSSSRLDQASQSDRQAPGGSAASEHVPPCQVMERMAGEDERNAFAPKLMGGDAKPSIVGSEPGIARMLVDPAHALVDPCGGMGVHRSTGGDPTVELKAGGAETNAVGFGPSYPLRRWAAASPPFGAYLHRVAASPITPLLEIQVGARQARRVALFAIFHESEGLFPHQQVLAAELRRAGFYVLGINSSHKVSLSTVRQMRYVFDGVILRSGDGMDFGSWLVGWSSLGPAVAELHELALVNDSCLPIGDVAALIDAMRNGPGDVCGVTDTWEQNYHLQSYLLLLKPAAVHSPAFHGWTNGYGFPRSRDDVIRQGELSLTQALVSGGLRVSAAYPYEQVAEAWLKRNLPVIDTEAEAKHGAGRRARRERVYIRDAILTGQPLNPMAYFPLELVADFGCPFIKKEPYVRQTAPYHVGDLRAILAAAAARSPAVSDMLIAAARLQSRGIAPPVSPSGGRQ